jgi:putative membrane-bound dehydrogenase-like protein
MPALSVPKGFVVEKVAQPPLVKYPMLGAFDDDGRLFVCESTGVNMNGEELLEKLPNFVRLLEDTDNDGQFDKSTIFADKMTLPSGALWHEGSLYVASPPSIWRLEDTDGDGVADQREELITGFNFRGHAGDIHGPHLGPDGRLYFPDGLMGHEIRDKEGRVISAGHTGRIFSCKPDGSDLETFCGGGMANPVAVAFTDVGELFAATTFFYYNTKDRIRHDALFHGVYGGVYPRRVSRLQSEFKLTGPLLPPLSLFGMSAPSNLMCYRSRSMGDEYQGNLFVSHFNTHRVTRFRLRSEGSTFRTESKPFLSSTNPDFHPCAVIEDADGSLLVIDTGGWFKEGCPTSSEQPEVLGAIYRVRRQDRRAVSDPRGMKLDWAAEDTMLVALLEDDRFAVRERAIATLARRGDAAVSALANGLKSSSERGRRNAVWTLTRIGTPAACEAVRQALHDGDEGVRQVAARCMGRHRYAAANDQLIELLRDKNPAVSRQAAVALGRIGRGESVGALFRAFETPRDRMLEHAVIFALIEINAPEETSTGLKAESLRVRRAALVALDQMGNENLSRELIAGLLPTDDSLLQDAIISVVAQKPEWTELVIDLLRHRLRDPKLDADRRRLVRNAIYALRRDPACQALVADALSLPDTPPESRLILFDVMTDSGFAEFPDAWHEGLVASLGNSDQSLARQALRAIDSTRNGQFDEALRQFSKDETQPIGLRVQAISVLSRNHPQLDELTFDLLCEQLGPDTAFESRLDAARTLGDSELTPTQLSKVVDLAARAGPLELPLLISSLARVWKSGSAELADRLFLTLESAPGFDSLTEEQLKGLFEAAPITFQPKAQKLRERLGAVAATSLRTHLRTSFILVGGDPARGKEIFYSKRALCSACHRAGPEERIEIGPDLRRIGEVRSPRDLLEAILAPSASFARGFESRTVITQSGRVISGVIRDESDEMLTLYTTERREVRIAQQEIEKIVPSKVSIMPHGLERLLTSDDMRDLLAWLSSLKSGE